MFKKIKGNIFNSSAQVLVNTRIDGSFRISAGRNTIKEEIKELIICLDNE